MTSRKAIVVDSLEQGPSVHGYRDDDGGLLFDTTPDRTKIYLKGINCTQREFMDWFLTIEESLDRWDLLSSCDDSLVDIGGSPIDLSVGTVLEITFDDYFEALIELRIKKAIHDIDRFIADKKVQIGIVTDVVVPYTDSHVLSDHELAGIEILLLSDS